MEVAEREEPRGALDGIRVLDVAKPFGAYVSRILGDLGADVIKIEPPGGDPGRQMAPLLPVGAEQLSLAFVHARPHVHPGRRYAAAVRLSLRARDASGQPARGLWHAQRPLGAARQRLWPGGRGVGARGAGPDLLRSGALRLWERHSAPHRGPQ